MYKLAQLKEAEVRGVLAALVDNGIVPVDNQDQFEKVAAETIDLVAGYDYDINDVAEASTYALNKVACEEEAQLALGQLTLQKVAGEIDDDTFDYYAAAIVKEAEDAAPAAAAEEGVWSKIKGGAKKFGKGYWNALKATDIREGWKKNPEGKRAWGKIGVGAAKTLGAYGVPIGAVGGGAYYLTHRKKSK